MHYAISKMAVSYNHANFDSSRVCVHVKDDVCKIVDGMYTVDHYFIDDGLYFVDSIIKRIY